MDITARAGRQALIERALEGRQHWDVPLLLEELQATLDFIRYAVAQLRTYNECGCGEHANTG